MLRTSIRLAAGSTLALAALQAVFAAPLTPGNLLVVRVGPGQSTTGTLSNASTPVALLEIDPATGNVVQAIDLPNSAESTSLTVSGTATSEAHLSYNAGLFSLTGYNTPSGLASVGSTTSAAVNRVVARIGMDGTVDLSTLLADAHSGGSIRMAVAIDGNTMLTAGAGSTGTGSVRYVTAGANPSVQLMTSPTNIRTVDIFGGDTYFSSASAGFVGVFQLSGIPTTGGQTPTAVLTNAATGRSPYGFIFMDGGNTLYLADDSGGTINQFGVWRYRRDPVTGLFDENQGVLLRDGIASASAAPRSITGFEDPSTGDNVLFITTTAGVLRLVDTGVPMWNVVAAPPASGFIYRGLRVIPAGDPMVRSISGTLNFGDAFSGTREATSTIRFQVFAPGDTGTPLFETTVDVDNTTKTYSFNLPAGVTASTVDVRIGGRESTFLYKRVAGVALGAAGATGVDATLVNGNIDTDESVTVFDYDLLSTAFDTNAGDAGFDPRADLDQDGSVTVFDYDILSSSFDLSDEN